MASLHDSRGFTFVELLVSTVVASVAAAGAYMLLDSGLSLYAKNFSLNLTHYTARTSLERMMPKINSAGLRRFSLTKREPMLLGTDRRPGSEYAFLRTTAVTPSKTLLFRPPPR